MVEGTPIVTSLITAAFANAGSRYRDAAQKWVKLSHQLGGPLLVMASINVQRAKDFDLLVRCMEDEASAAAQIGQQPTGLDMAFHYQKMLSEIWIAGCYEFARTIRQREFEAKKANIPIKGWIRNPTFISVFADLELLRVPMEKYELPQDKKLTDPVEFVRVPPKGDESDVYVYTQDDPTRSHMLPIGISARKSVMWHATDAVAGTSRWIERRELADRILRLADVSLA